jgi:hypothetical protein
MSDRSRKATLGLCIALFVGAAVLPADAAIVQRLNYETGNLGQWTAVQALPGRASVVRSPVRQGRFAARFVVRPGDDPIGASGERSEVLALTGEGEGVESWWAWSTRFPRGFRPNPGSWNVFTQWHHTGSLCTIPVSFVVDKPSGARAWLKVVVRGGRLNVQSCEAETQREWRVVPLRRGRWYDFRFHVRWSANQSLGFVELWVNRKRRIVLTATATLYRGEGVYLKQGFYRGAGSWSAAVVHDGMRRFTP